MARSTTCAATGRNIALGITINVATPIQAVLRAEEEVVDHVETGRDGVLPPVGSSHMIGTISYRGVPTLRTELSGVVRTEVFTAAGEREPVVKHFA